MRQRLVFVAQRILLPLALILSLAFRPYGISIIYLLLLLLSPFARVPKRGSGCCTPSFVLIVFITSLLILLLHAVWHATLVVLGYTSVLAQYPLLRAIAYNLGFVAFQDVRWSLLYLAPDVVLFILSLILYIIIKRLLRNIAGPEPINDDKYQMFPLLTTAGKYLSLLMVLCCGILKPSATSGLYFLVFISVTTAWSLGQPLRRGFAVTSKCVMLLMAAHSLVIFVYQTSFVNELYPPTEPFARYFGLYKLVDLDDKNYQTYNYEKFTGNWSRPMSALVILLTYLFIAMESQQLWKPKMKAKPALGGMEAGRMNGSFIRGVSLRGSRRLMARDKWINASKKVNLLSRTRSTQKPPNSRTVSVSYRTHQDSAGSMLITENEESPGEEQKVMGDIVAAIFDFFQILVRSSYIATTIIMMAWSIMYHSWLAGVFLVWSSIVWMTRDQRSFMLRSSPFLVFYAILLLLGQYIYSMDLLESELPSNVQQVNLHQIGFGHNKDSPFVPLLIKSLFTCMFWLTLRQRSQERRERRRSAVISDLAAPLHLTLSTAATVPKPQETEGESRLLRAFGEWMRAMCVRYWIYVVVIMLFVIGITGERMTIFRIIYMFLFLTFILIFQMSLYWWRRLMYAFWITVIIYSIVNLTLIYVYQFDDCSKLIANYLHINEELQHDLGLLPYERADLFIKLLTPTLFLIMAVMQVNYFHRDFMRLSEGESQRNKDIESNRGSHLASTMKDDLPPLPLEQDATSVPKSPTPSKNSTEADMSSINFEPEKPDPTQPQTRAARAKCTLYKLLKRLLALTKEWINYCFIYINQQMIHILLIALMLLSVLHVTALHVPIVFIISIATLLPTSKRIGLMIITSFLICGYFMLNMVYQIDYIDENTFKNNCTSIQNGTENQTTYNNAEWFGVFKIKKYRSLAKTTEGYIALMALFTFRSLVVYRQKSKVEKGELSTLHNHLMFPKITRADADKDLNNCIKYLFNYAFYKFGVEITLIYMMAVIGSRMDLYAVLYSIWLVILVSMKRTGQARVWPVFTIFIVVVIPLQYMIVTGAVPYFCVVYPWHENSEYMKGLRNWAFLPHPDNSPYAIKILFDFILLLFASRQLRVFRLESRKSGDLKYPGGSNSEDIDAHWETPLFVNPVPDFLGSVGTWLDIIKRVVFLLTLWVTLAIMFLSGTNRVNIFSIGYLIGSFTFLWQGTELYLRPKPTLLLWWSRLLNYNVSVVMIKTILQIVGCLFIDVVQTHACWLVQLLGIGCVDKFVGGNITNFIKMTSYVKKDSCTVPQEDIGLVWDGICFAFLILQKRIFQTYYFYRILEDYKATTVLSSRGAELMEELRQKQMQVQEDQEKKILEKIKAKMEKIKAIQQKVRSKHIQQPSNHDAGDCSGPGLEREISYRQEHDGRYSPTTHIQAIRSGDYYMFDDMNNSELQLDLDKDEDEEDNLKEVGLGKLLSESLRTDVRRAVARRRASMPLVLRSSFRLSSGPHSVTQHDIVSQVMASHSFQDDIYDAIEEVNKEESRNWWQRVKQWCVIGWAFISSCLMSLTHQLLKFSRQYRYVSRILFIEKKALKDIEGFGIGLRPGTRQIWEPTPEILARLNRLQDDIGHKNSDVDTDVEDDVFMGRKLSGLSVPEIRILAPSMEGGLNAPPSPAPGSPPASPAPSGDDDGTSEHESMFSLQTSGSKDLSTLEEQDDSMFQKERCAFVYLAYAICYAILAHTDIMCYLFVFINQIQSATILSIPLPLMVFLWGTLSIPRPSKTFWITLIAYTEAIVLIKSMFQFEILPWNQRVIASTFPFSAPRVIGIERKSNYALYDLLLLLMIFLHRYTLKSLGLWKDPVSEKEAYEDKKYPATDQDIEEILDGDADLVGEKYLAKNMEERLSSGKGDKDTESYNTSLAIVQKEGLQTDAREAGPSKLSDDDHYKVNDDKEPIIIVTNAVEEIPKTCPMFCLSLKKYSSPIVDFFQIMGPGSRVTADVYAYMFMCDFFNFLVVIFGFAAFGTHQGDGGVQAYLEENKVPIPFLVMLILQFALIVIDRALYLRKFIFGKIVFQYALIVGVHIWMFFVLPFITERKFNSLLPPPLWYMTKCVYLLLSAYQIRCGYPRRIIGNFLCKSYSFINMVLFRCFMLVPFVFELRTLMDWIWTDTSMTLLDWLKMEDIFSQIFLLKCSHTMEEKYPQARGAKKKTSAKYLLGGSVLAFLIAIAWFPLVFFAFGNTVGTANPPTDVTVKIRIGPFLPIYQMSAQSHNIQSYTDLEYVQLLNLYPHDRSAETFLSNYVHNDVAAVTLHSNSTLQWIISPPELDRLEREALSNATMVIRFTFMITHKTNSAQNPPTIEDSYEATLPAYIGNQRNPERDKLLQLLDGTANSDVWLNVNNIFPKFLKVFNKGIAKPASQLTMMSDERSYRGIQMRLERDKGAMYWRVREQCDKGTDYVLLSIPHNDCNMLVMFTFNDKLFPETLNFISAGGIIGLYTTFVFLASRVLRGFFSGIYAKIMFDDLPNVDRILQLCLDIYLVREALEYRLEEDLFAKLIFLYRSPETMIKWTRPKLELDRPVSQHSS